MDGFRLNDWFSKAVVGEKYTVTAFEVLGQLPERATEEAVGRNTIPPTG